MAAFRFICVVMMLLLFCTACLSVEHAFRDGNEEDTRLQVVSSRKAEMVNIAVKRMAGGRKLALEVATEKSSSRIKGSGNGQFNKQVTKVRNSPSTKTSRGVSDHEVDEDGLVAYTADYWRARHHPPKNN